MVGRRNLIAKVLLAFIVFALFLIAAPRAQAQDVTLSQDDWNACLTYQAEYRNQKAVITRLGELVEREKNAASHCMGIYQATSEELARIRASRSVVREKKSWLVFGSLILSGASSVVGGFLVSDYPLVGGILLGAGGAGIVVNGVFW